MLKNKVAAYITELNGNTDAGSRSHVTLHQLYRTFGKDKVNAELERQFNAEKTVQFHPQVRFNWGFHDATQDGQEGRAARDMSTHSNTFYAAGYTSGYKAWTQTRTRPEQSEPAWFSYVTETPGALEKVRLEELKQSTEYCDEAIERAAHDALRR